MRNRLRLSAIIASLMLCLPAVAAAQKDVFVDAFVAFHSALPGNYGDEGPQVATEFARMADALIVWDRAAAAAEAALKKRGATPGEFALHYVEHQRIELALNAINAAVAEEPARASLYLFQGQLLEALGRVADAITAFTKARQLDPDDPLAAYLVATRTPIDAANTKPLVDTLHAARSGPRALAGRPFAELALIQDLSSAVPIFAPARYVDAIKAFAARRYHDAVDEFRVATARDPLVADPAARSSVLLDGVAALRANKPDDAIARLEAAVKASPESSESRRVLGIVYRAVGRRAEAIAQFEIAMRLRPDDERSRLALGATLAEAGKPAEAERELRAAIKALPMSGHARWALADILHQQNRGAEAIDLLREAVALPVVAGRVHLLWRLAELVHGYRRDFEHVTVIAAQRVRLVPNEPGGHKDLGLAYRRAGRDEEAAIELTMTALLGQEDAETLSAMGQIHFNGGRFEESVASLRRAISMDPKAADARYLLSQSLQRLGREAEALQELDAFNKLRAASFDEQRRQFERDNGTTAGTVQ